MSDTFNPRRFRWLLKKTLLERPAYVLGLFALVLGSSLLIFSFFGSFGNWEPAHIITLFLGLAGGGCFIMSSMFGYFSSNAGGTAYLTLPVSNFEKWLCSVLVVIVFFLPIFLLFFRLMDTTFINVYHKNLDHALPNYDYLYQKAHIFSFRDPSAMVAFITFFNCTGAMLLGTLYFNKVSFIKTSIIMCALFILTFVLNYYLSKVFFQNVNYAVPFNEVEINVEKEVGVVELPAASFLVTGFIIRYISPVCLWALAYLRLKEKEF